MHQVIWGVPSVNETVEIRIFPKEASASNDYEMTFEFHENYLHYPIYNVTGFESKFLTAKKPQFVETELHPGEYIFIPHDSLVSLRLKTSSSSGNPKKPTIDARILAKKAGGAVGRKLKP